MRFELRRAALRRRCVFGSLGLLPIAAVALYFLYVPVHPVGFSIDESSICYNAYTVSQSGCDEYGVSWPLFFRAFGEYKNPTLIYLLAGLFRITGPSIAGARLLVASCGVLSGVMLGLLAWQMTRRWVATALVTFSTLLTPWLFESSRLVFEVAIYPALLALFLLVVWRASLRQRWSWADVLMLAMMLALLTYSYSIGRLLAPLLAVGLGWFIDRVRWRRVIATWVVYGLLLIPLFIFHREHPGALLGRFKALTYLSAEKPIAASLGELAQHYFANVNPGRWLVTGEGDIRDHLQGTGSLLAGSVLLAILGLVVVLRHRGRQPWWRFLIYCLVVSPVPASLTGNPFPQLRLIAFPVFFLTLTIPAIEWLTQSKSESHRVTTAKRLLLATTAVAVLAQGLIFQWRYHETAPKLWYVFDARFARKVLAPALATGRRPLALVDEPGKSGYIHALWHGVVAGLNPKQFVRLPWGNPPPPGAVVLSTEEECHDCRLIARALNYIVYSVPPYPNETLPEKAGLAAFSADIVCENPPSILIAGQTVDLRFVIKNISSVEWPCVGDGNDGAVTFQDRWRNQAEVIMSELDGERKLPYDVEPGDTVLLVLKVTPPAEPGDYYLEADLLQKPASWFSERGSIGWRSKVRVLAGQ